MRVLLCTALVVAAIVATATGCGSPSHDEMRGYAYSQGLPLEGSVAGDYELMLKLTPKCTGKLFYGSTEVFGSGMYYLQILMGENILAIPAGDDQIQRAASEIKGKSSSDPQVQRCFDSEPKGETGEPK